MWNLCSSIALIEKYLTATKHRLALPSKETKRFKTMKIAVGKKEGNGVASAHGAELGSRQTGRAALSNGSGCSSSSSSSSSRRKVDEVKCCRICYDDSNKQGMIVPCLCSGSMKWVHRTCLDEWRVSSKQERAFSHCCNCGSPYQLVKFSHQGAVPDLVPRKLLLLYLLVSILVAFVVGDIFTEGMKILRESDDFALQIMVVCIILLTVIIVRKMQDTGKAIILRNVDLKAEKVLTSMVREEYAVKDLALGMPL